MKKNMGSSDRTVRFGLAILIVAFYFNNILTGILGLLLMFLAGILAITSLFRFCPFYLPFGINTKEKMKS
jgi:hypothetical protein